MQWILVYEVQRKVSLLTPFYFTFSRLWSGCYHFKWWGIVFLWDSGTCPCSWLLNTWVPSGLSRISFPCPWALLLLTKQVFPSNHSWKQHPKDDKRHALPILILPEMWLFSNKELLNLSRAVKRQAVAITAIMMVSSSWWAVISKSVSASL